MGTLERRMPPGGGTRKTLAGETFSTDYTPLNAAAAKSLQRELFIVLNAAHRMASGHGLHFDDFDRLHQAHQFILTVLADMTGREVHQ